MITIYKDSSANAIFIEDANGVQFVNSLQATIENGFCSIQDLARGIEIVTDEPFDSFEDENGNSYGNNSTEVCNALNAIFSSSGTPTENAPNITSSLAISLVEGETLNYELTADYGVAYEWDLSNVSGVATVEGNVRKLVGGSSLVAGTYNIPVKAINYNGEDSEVLVLTVATPSFANTKSVRFNNNDWLGGNAGILQNVLGRSANGSGSSDAWTISFWFKSGTSTNAAQTIVYYGNSDVANKGYIQIKYNGSAKSINMRYGTNNNRLNINTQNNSLTSGQWQHVLVTYDGGTTGAQSDQLNSYFSRFKIFINGGLQTTINGHVNYGYTGTILPVNWRLGVFNQGQTMRNNCLVDELALFDSDQSSNISDIYNSGSPFDLSTLTTEPKHWWRMGDGDTYPYLQDSGTEGNCIFQMNNMTSADIVNDVP